MPLVSPTRDRAAADRTAPRRASGLAAILTLAASLAWACLGLPAAADPIRLRVVGGLAGVTQFVQLEQPFWQRDVERLTGGRVTATIHPYDGSGLRGQEMLHLMQLGVVPFGTAILGAAAGEDPQLDIADLPALSPDMPALRVTAGLFREHLRQVLRDRHGVELLGLYVYSAQVTFCARPFRGLGDLAGRRVRTSSVGQSELVDALGGIPVKLPFAGLAAAMKEGVVDCAITGTQSAIEIGLSDVATHVSDTAISWGLSIFAANAEAWQALPPDLRATLQAGIADLESRIWDRAERDTAQGLACNVGAPECPAPQRKRLVLAHDPDDAGARRRLLTDHVLPRWLDRCGPECGSTWNRIFGTTFDIRLGER